MKRPLAHLEFPAFYKSVDSAEPASRCALFFLKSEWHGAIRQLLEVEAHAEL